jgi:hypothetical protein
MMRALSDMNIEGSSKNLMLASEYSPFMGIFTGKFIYGPSLIVNLENTIKNSN